MNKSAQENIIEASLDWDLVQSRLEMYPHIAAAFPLEDMRSCECIAPYFCHFIAWRLGTWVGDKWFAFFDSILSTSSVIPGWNKSRIPFGCDHQAFWGFIWELQVANWLVLSDWGRIEWLAEGPDLLLEASTFQLFIECTTYLKSYALDIFASELLTQVDHHLALRHTPFNIYSLPKDSNVEEFLDELLKPTLDVDYLSCIASSAKQRSPARLKVPHDLNNIYLLYEIEDAIEVDMVQPWATTGNPIDFLQVAWKEVIDNKRESNQLKSHRPNILAVNFLLGDYQLAAMLRKVDLNIEFGSTFDAVLFSTCGIDELPSANNSKLHTRSETFPLFLDISQSGPAA